MINALNIKILVYVVHVEHEDQDLLVTVFNGILQMAMARLQNDPNLSCRSFFIKDRPSNQ